MASTSNSRIRKVLTLAERVKVIELMVKGKSARVIALFLGFGKMQIQGILGRQEHRARYNILLQNRARMATSASSDLKQLQQG